MNRLLLFCILLFCHLLNAEEPVWLSDYGSASKQAKEEEKPILMLFTGDWIPICQEFEKNILSTTAFTEEVGKRAVLLKLNFPKEGILPPGQMARYQFLKDTYRIQGYPSLVLADSEGKPFGVNGFQSIDVAAYVAQMLETLDYGEAAEQFRKKAESLDGTEKAESLISGIPQLPGSLAARFYEAEMQQVIDADPQNSLGMTETYQRMLDDVKYAKAMQTLANNEKWEEMLSLTDQYMVEKQLEGEALQHAMFTKAGLFARLGRADLEVSALRALIDVDSNSILASRAKELLVQREGAKE